MVIKKYIRVNREFLDEPNAPKMIIRVFEKSKNPVLWHSKPKIVSDTEGMDFDFIYNIVTFVATYTVYRKPRIAHLFLNNKNKNNASRQRTIRRHGERH